MSRCTTDAEETRKSIATQTTSLCEVSSALRFLAKSLQLMDLTGPATLINAIEKQICAVVDELDEI